MVNLEKIGWQNGTLVSKAKVEIGGQIYEVEPEEYSGTTPLSAENLTQMETNTEEAINTVDYKVVGENLYNNTVGANNNITLSETIANFSKIEIYYSVSIGNYTINESKKIKAADNMDISLSCEIAHSDIMQIFDVGRWHVSGTSISKVHETDGRITSSGYTWNGSSNKILINQIIGYR